MSLTTADVDRLGMFYERALGFERDTVEERGGPDFARLMEIEGARARSLTMQLGRQRLELLAFSPAGMPYPAPRHSNDPWFQHMAIVVSDMGAAYGRLASTTGWTPITTPEPQRLPASSGGVSAFKFRDPDGHPLELLQFPADRTPPAWRAPPGAGPCLGIDHSAITVAATAVGIDFYTALFGFSVLACTLNRGREQEHLDALPGAIAEVTALGAREAPPPHLELLCYPAPPASPRLSLRNNDIAATRLVLETAALPSILRRIGGETPQDRPSAALVRDPDGHALLLKADSALTASAAHA